ncbi:hypothetical protein CO173_04795 [Candidatus Uhrbacteria bacterium CG_4_9_14_3_um_filter_41_35]|uniref:Uncharacterized protein n=1 Tax=Candidatus Uhrbacteria bacterium CG_4_9_14_3_um_filter_41_35 TaxID=1975034 RepID=A0A2M7XCX9_9BACT|nr:MAG: hypothetical protein CO173_04795 [Candidatus Uhrbacteria bacterium CG_4_9_14_3_um_filter_41_35]
MIKKLFQLLIILTPVLLFCYLVWIDISPKGEFFVHHAVDEISPFIDALQPTERVSVLQYTGQKEAYLALTDDPVYLSLHLPRTKFEKIKIAVEFESKTLPIFEFGPLVDIFSNGFDLRPAQNLIIDNSKWHRLEEGGLTLLERNNNYETISDFFEKLPPVSKIATYAYSLNAPFRVANYEPLTEKKITEVSLRGYHKYLTYLEDEEFYLEIEAMDMNRTTGVDDIVVTVRNHEGIVVLEEKLEDDNNTTENQISSTLKIILQSSNLAPGVYSVELRATTDIFWRKFISAERYMTFINRIYIADDVGYLPERRATSFITNAKQFTFETFHADATQEISLGSMLVDIPKSNEKISVLVKDKGLISANSPGGDIRINGDGKFAFSKDAFFDPEPVNLQATTDLDARDIDYILTAYKAPETRGVWHVAESEFMVDSIVDADNNARLVFSAPEIDSLGGEIWIHAINLTFEKSPLNFEGFLKAVRERLPFGL